TILLTLLFTIIRRTPRPPLFPYTTLFRSDQHRHGLRALPVDRLPGPVGDLRAPPDGGQGPRAGHAARERHRDQGARRPARSAHRSEEHTSELQSRGHLVCRLLLEKKKRDP